MADVLSTINKRKTPQSKPARAGQVKNAAGGYVFKVGDMERLRRFLILGTDGPTYYTSAHDLTADNAEVVFRVVATEPEEALRTIVDVSTSGRAPKANPAIFALAIAAADANESTRKAALAVLPQVCRTFTHLALFNKYVEQFRGRGRALNTAVARWYTEKPVEKLAYQIVKYRNREGLTHADVLRKARPQNVSDPARRMALNFAVGKGLNDYDGRVDTRGWKRGDDYVPPRPKLHRAERLPEGLAIIADFEDAQKATTPREWVEIINRGHGVSWEMLPDAAMNEPSVWEAMLHQGVPVEAMMRQLPRLTNLGLCTGETGKLIVGKLTDAEVLKRARMHPIKVLVAQRTYAGGHALRGNTMWSPVSQIVDALDQAFYLAYGAVEPANKRTLVGVDVSGSMSWGNINGIPMQPREVCGALALVTAATEPDTMHVGFTTGAWRLDISPRRRLDDVLRYLAQQPSGGTDCALPMLFAIQNDLKVDTFIVLTDGESWYGRVHPFQALEMYRQKSGINAKLVTAAMTATGTSINAPDDPGVLDVVGFDTSVPQMASDFSAGRL